MAQTTCSAEGCDRTAYARGFCERHYRKHRKEHGRVYEPKASSCQIDGCTRDPKAKGLCSVHYGRKKNRGDASLPALRIRGRRPCAIRGCDQKATNHGHCAVHHRRIMRTGEAGAPLDRKGVRVCGYCEAPYESPSMAKKYCGEECAKMAKSLREAYRRYGIEMRDYRRIWFEQKGVCAICKQPERAARTRLLVIDHEHDTGLIRGLLCSQCNRAIGLLREDPKVLRAAVKYVEAPRLIA